MSDDRTLSSVNFNADVDAEDVILGLSNNDGLILPFIIEMLDHAGSSELEEDLLLRLQERLGLNKVELPTDNASEEVRQ